MSIFRFIAASKSTIVVKKDNSEQLLKEFSIGSTSSGCILCVSDGSMIRVINDSDVVEFHGIVQGSANVTIIDANVLEGAHGELEIEGDVTWLTFMNYPQRLIITQEAPAE